MFQFFKRQMSPPAVKAKTKTSSPKALRLKLRDPFFQVEAPQFSEINILDVHLKQFFNIISGDRTQVRFFFNHLTRESDPYKTLHVPKKNGSVRYLSQPNKRLRLFSTQILRMHLDEVGLYHSNAYAYIRGKSAVQCARQHENAKWLLKIDIQDFFHTIDERMVFWALLNAGARRYLAFFLARVLTRLVPDSPSWLPEKYSKLAPAKPKSRFRKKPSQLGFLPQGLPTSGALANLVCYPLDVRLNEFATKNNLTYTRYADDIIFSSTTDFNRPSATKALHNAIRLIEKFGFGINRNKTRIIPPGARKQILGVLAGEGALRIPRSVRERIDQSIWALEKFGLESHAEHLGAESPGFLVNQITGRLLWAREVDKNWSEIRLAKLGQLISETLSTSNIEGFDFKEFQAFSALKVAISKASIGQKWKVVEAIPYKDALLLAIRVNSSDRFLQIKKTGDCTTTSGTWDVKWVPYLQWRSGVFRQAFTFKVTKAKSPQKALADISERISTISEHEDGDFS